MRRVGVSLLVVAALTASCGGADSPDPVTLRRSTVTWETYDYELTRFNTIRSGSFDGTTRIERTFDTWVLENELLEVTLLPEFGGRILSMIYKPTGHEQLYRNPLGVPYQIGTGVFFFDWLMVYGGIFPTFPEPEHGKTWFLPWEFSIVEDTSESVTVAMSFVDDDDHPLAPARYRGEASGLKVTFFVTLTAGRAAIDTEIVIENPGAEPVTFEYWTNTTLAPGSDPDDPRATAGAEIIAPVDMIKIPSYWQAIAGLEDRTGLPEIHTFDTLRRFEGWADLGIAYAFPNLRATNFWGVVNHDNGEGIFRIADNTVTPGMKIWTWGYPQTVDPDPDAGPLEARPYIELWAGLTPEFFHPTEIAGQGEIRITETYAPTVGLDDVTHASSEFLVDLRLAAAGRVEADIFGLRPGTALTAIVSADGAVLHEAPVVPDPAAAHELRVPLPEDDPHDVVTLDLVDESGAVVFDALLEAPAAARSG